MRRRLNSRAYDPYDEWLDSIGLYRKQLARDGSCLFRAVAEQVLFTQTEHERVRALCLEYMVLHREDFEPFLDIPLDHHVFNLQDCREWGGHLEIMAMSRLFNVNFLIYQEIGKEPYKATDNDGRTLMMSHTNGNHYDIIYKKEDSSSRGFCQSMMYDMLYSKFFKLDDIRLAVDTMLHDKEYASLRRDSANSAEIKEIGALVEKVLGTSISRDSQDDGDKNTSTEEKISIEDIHEDDVKGLLAHGIPPFPYKVAKSLDPDIYRNIEYDTWNTIRREARYGPFDCNGFQAGVKVLIKLDLLPNRQEVEDMRKALLDRSGSGETNEPKSGDDKEVFHGHIQEMSENKGEVDVYIEEIGCRLNVPYASLQKVPPSSPHAITAPGGIMPTYKKLSGFYQKAPLAPENDFAGGKKKAKGKPVREVLSMFPIPHTPHVRYNGPNIRGVTASSPRNQGANSNRNSSRGRGINSGMGSCSSPSRDDFPSFSSSANLPMGLEGVWAVRPPVNQTIVASTPKANSTSFYPTTPQPPMGEDETRLQIQAVTEALQHVMSAGGQTVRVSGQQLEVVEDQACVHHINMAPQEDNGKDHRLDDQEEPSNCLPQSRLEDGSVQPSFCQSDTNLHFMSTPPPSFTQISGSSTPQDAMYTVTYPPYGSPAYVQMLTTVPPSEETLTSSEVTPPPASVSCKADSIDENSRPSSEQLKANQGMTPVMVYQVPVMYGTYGYNCNQPYPFVPAMASPGAEDGKPPPVPGSEVYQPMVPMSCWGSGYVGDVIPPQVPPNIPPQNMMPYQHESPMPQYPPPPAFHERPHYHPRGRGRGGGPSHQNRGQHNDNSAYNSYADGMYRSGGQRPLPPRLRRGGGGPSGRGGMRYPFHHTNNNNPPNNYQRSHQYEGQPLLQMGSGKSSNEILVSQVPVGSSSSSGIPAPPVVSYVEDRPPGIYPLIPQDGSPLPPQDPMAYYTVPPGYVMGPPWMWMMM